MGEHLWQLFEFTKFARVSLVHGVHRHFCHLHFFVCHYMNEQHFVLLTATGVLMLVDNGLPNPDRGTACLTQAWGTTR